jgi:hypothetical protein
MTMFEKLDRDEFNSDGLRGLSVVAAVLRAPGALIRDLRVERNLTNYALSLVLTTVLFSAAYGAILGLFKPGMQTLFAAAKLPIVVLGTALLCTPTFYVFNAILGSKFSFRQTLTCVLFLSVSVSIVLVAFAPITWFFTVSTQGPGFLTFLHVLVFLIAALYGLHSLNTARKYLDQLEEDYTPINGAFLFLWSLIVLFVGLQMAYTLRPFLEPLQDGRFMLGERGLFFEAFRK